MLKVHRASEKKHRENKKDHPTFSILERKVYLSKGMLFTGQGIERVARRA